MNIKKVIGWGGQWKWGTLPNFLFEVELQVYTNIQSISTLVCLLFDANGFVMCNYYFFYNTCCKIRTLGKWRFWSLQSLLLPQFSTYRHRTRFIVKRKQVRINKYLGIPRNCYFFLQLFKVVYFAPKTTQISKNSIKFIF